MKAAAAIHVIDSGDKANVANLPACRSATDAAFRTGAASEMPPSVRAAGRRLAFRASASQAVAQRGGAEVVDEVLLARASVGASAKTDPALKAEATRVPGSALVSDRDVAIDSSVIDWHGWRLTLFTHRAKPDVTQLLALAARSLQIGPGLEHIVWFPQPSGLLNLTVMEHLYRHAFSLETSRTFRFIVADRKEATFGEDGVAVNQAQFLRTLAVARQCAAAVVQPRQGVTVVRWRAVTMQPEQNADSAADSDLVSIGLMDMSNPLEKADVTFWRLPHLGCNARTGTDGIATCRLIDSAGHTKHPGFDSAPIVVTYAGHIAADFVLLPTTLSISR